MKTALITGASSGLGVDFAHILAERHINLVLVARSESKLEEVAKNLSSQHGIKCHVIALDLARHGSANTLVQELKNKRLKIDILINNAGYGLWGAFAESEFPVMSGMMQLNVNTLVELTRLLLPDMISRGTGHVLNVASTAAFQPGPWMAVYYATKAFVLWFSEGLAEELKGTGVSVTTLCPGPTRTEFFERAQMGNSRLKRMMLAESRVCAQNGVDAMFRNRAVVIDGMMNWIIALTPRWMPRSAMRKLAGMINASASN